MRLLIVRSFYCFLISLSWKFRKVISKWEAERLSENLSSIEKLDPDRINSGQIREAALNRAWLRKVIPEYPYWTEGHLAYAELSLVVGDIESAYAASITSSKIGSGSERTKADGLRGICFLRTGELEQALPLLETAYQNYKNLFEEDYIACLIAMRRYEQAEKVIRQTEINKAKISNKIVLSFINEKLSKKI